MSARFEYASGFAATIAACVATSSARADSIEASGVRRPKSSWSVGRLSVMAIFDHQLPYLYLLLGMLRGWIGGL